MDPLVVVSFVFFSLLEVLLPLALGFFFSKRFNVSWKIFVFGALFFVLVQVIHAPLVLVMQQPFMQSLSVLQNKALEVGLFALVLGFLAGIFEEPGRYLVFKYFFKKRKLELKKQNALLFGLGWGGVESALVGAVLFLTMFSYVFAAPLTEKQFADINAAYGGKLTPGDIEAINKQNETLMKLQPLDLFPSFAERAMTLSLHVWWTMLVFASVAFGRKSLLFLAIALHTAVDAIAVFLGVMGAGTLVIEGVVFAFAIAGLLHLRVLWLQLKAKPAA